MTPTTPTVTNYPQLLDGFVFSGLFGLRPNNHLSWYWECLRSLESLRLAADSFRPRSWVVPKNFTDPNRTNSANIEPGQTEFYEFQVKEGSWLWGIQFAVFNDALDQSQFSVIIRQGSDLPFFDRVMSAAGIYSNSPTDAFNTLYPPVGLFTEPRLIIPPCQLHVEVSNDSDPADSENAVSCQLLLLFAEPK